MWWKPLHPWLRQHVQLRSVRGERLCGTGPPTERAVPAEPPSTRVVQLSGSLCRDSAIESLRRQCLEDIKASPRRLVLDLEHVEQVDTKFIACLVCLRRTAQAAGVHLELRLSPRVKDWLTLCKAGHLFGILTPQDPA